MILRSQDESITLSPCHLVTLSVKNPPPTAAGADQELICLIEPTRASASGSKWRSVRGFHRWRRSVIAQCAIGPSRNRRCEHVSSATVIVFCTPSHFADSSTKRRYL